MRLSMHKQTYGVWCSNPEVQPGWLTAHESEREDGMPKIGRMIDGAEIFIRSSYEVAEEKAGRWRENFPGPFNAKLYAVCSCCEKEFDTDDGGQYDGSNGLSSCVPCHNLVCNLMQAIEEL